VGKRENLLTTREEKVQDGGGEVHSKKHGSQRPECIAPALKYARFSEGKGGIQKGDRRRKPFFSRLFQKEEE